MVELELADALDSIAGMTQRPDGAWVSSVLCTGPWDQPCHVQDPADPDEWCPVCVAEVAWCAWKLGEQPEPDRCPDVVKVTSRSYGLQCQEFAGHHGDHRFTAGRTVTTWSNPVQIGARFVQQDLPRLTREVLPYLRMLGQLEDPRVQLADCRPLNEILTDLTAVSRWLRRG